MERGLQALSENKKLKREAKRLPTLVVFLLMAFSYAAGYLVEKVVSP